MLTIYVDADACPVKQEVARVAKRYRLQIVFVANTRMRIPEQAGARLQIVENNCDAADDWIADHVKANDIVVTADIPLASRCVDHSALVLDPTGRQYDEHNIGQALATRNLLAELREGGLETGGPPPFQGRDRSRFLQSLDNLVQKISRDV